MKINKRYLIIISAILLIAIVGFSLYYYLVVKKAGQEVGQQTATSQLESELKERAEFVASSTVKRQEQKLSGFTYAPLTQEKCNSESGDDKVNCLNLLKADEAVQKNNYKICGSITDPETRFYCIMKFIRKDGDANLCKAINNEKWEETCISQLAFLTGNLDLCKFDDANEQAECEGPIKAYMYAATGDVEGCKQINVLEYSGLCFERIINNYDRNCLMFSDSNDQIACQNLVSYEDALETGNEKLCQLITDESRKTVCINYLTIGPQADSDHDGITDNKELWFNTDPFNPDTDGDGLSDGDEMNKYHTDPANKDNKDEVIEKYNQEHDSQLLVDTDGDGLTDSDEINIYHTDPNNPDTDGDGYKDGDEINNGYNPNGQGRLAN